MKDKAFERELGEAFARLKRMRPGDDSVPEGVTSSEMQALLSISFLKRRTGSARPSTAASALHITKSAFSQTLKSLEAKGLVERTRSSEDSRASELSITPAGQAILEEADAMRKQYIDGLLEHIGRDDLEHCLRVIEKIIEYQQRSGFETCDTGFGDDECM